MVKRVGQKKRGKYSRKPKKIILIGTEGNNQTEKNYFTAFNQTQSEYKSETPVLLFFSTK